MNVFELGDETKAAPLPAAATTIQGYTTNGRCTAEKPGRLLRSASFVRNALHREESSCPCQT